MFLKLFVVWHTACWQAGYGFSGTPFKEPLTALRQVAAARGAHTPASAQV